VLGAPACASALAERDVVVAELRGRSLSALVGALQSAGACVRVVPDLAGVRRAAAVLGPRAAVVLDVAVGAAALGEGLRALGRQDALLLVSAGASSAERIHLLRCGADHVLAVPEPEELVAVLSAVLRRADVPQPTRAPELLSCGSLSVHLPTRQGTSGGRLLSLTALEFDLLAYFIAHAGEALGRERLLADVWGYDIGGLETVTVHVRRLRKKIESDPSRPLMLETVWGVGYRLALGADESAAAFARSG
jgi:DNA-binding response OmpR family regulator